MYKIVQKKDLKKNKRKYKNMHRHRTAKRITKNIKENKPMIKLVINLYTEIIRTNPIHKKSKGYFIKKDRNKYFSQKKKNMTGRKHNKKTNLLIICKSKSTTCLQKRVRIIKIEK